MLEPASALPTHSHSSPKPWEWLRGRQGDFGTLGALTLHLVTSLERPHSRLHPCVRVSLCDGPPTVPALASPRDSKFTFRALTRPRPHCALTGWLNPHLIWEPPDLPGPRLCPVTRSPGTAHGPPSSHQGYKNVRLSHSLIGVCLSTGERPSALVN